MSFVPNQYVPVVSNGRAYQSFARVQGLGSRASSAARSDSAPLEWPPSPSPAPTLDSVVMPPPPRPSQQPSQSSQSIQQSTEQPSDTPSATPTPTPVAGRKRKADSALRDESAVTTLGITRQQHLAALRIQLLPEMKDKWRHSGYWFEVMQRYNQTGLPQHKNLNRTLPRLEKEFDKWLKGEGASETGRENEDELTVARREWAEFKAQYDSQQAALKQTLDQRNQARAATTASRDDMMNRQGRKRARVAGREADFDGYPEPDELDSMSNHDESSEDVTSEGSRPEAAAPRRPSQRPPSTPRLNSSSDTSARSTRSSRPRRQQIGPEEDDDTSYAIRHARNAFSDWLKGQDQADRAVTDEIREVKTQLTSHLQRVEGMISQLARQQANQAPARGFHHEPQVAFDDLGIDLGASIGVKSLDAV
ncbi:hypothetical protein KC361_g8666 [Hortaea werneckii]|nr:hypothetical protein KC361_g8666 [Hortaea werneckii]